MNNEYKDILGYENSYIVYDNGIIKSLDRYIEKKHRNGKVVKCFIRGHIINHCINNKGYHMVHLNKNGSSKTYLVSRLVAQAFIPNPQNKEQVNHIDGNKKNNAVWNLEWATPQENTQHSIVTELRKTKTKDLTGERFGNLVVKRYLGDIRKAGALRHLWECQCDCGKVVTVIDNNLITGHAQSCGCQKGARKWRNPLSVMMR